MSESTTTKPLPSGVQLTALDPAYREDPYPILDLLREQAPAMLDPLLGSLILTRHADVERVLRDRDLMVDPRKATNGSMMARLRAQRMEEADANPSMLFLDPPDHDRLRGLVNKAFTPKAVEAMAPRIREIAAELLDRLEGRDEFDIIHDYSAPLPTIVISEMLGVNPADQAQFKAWSDEIVRGLDPFITQEDRDRIGASSEALGQYVRKVIEERRAHRTDDLISAMINAEEDGERMTDLEIVTMCSLLLLAGNLTTTDLIGNGMLALLRNPEQLAKLRANPGLINNAVEEMIRYDPPVTQSGRISMKEMEVGGCPVHPGMSISPSLAGANHDPAVHPNPHAFDIERENIQHVSFGGGRRYCLGAPLARLETQIAVVALVDRFPTLKLVDPNPEHRGNPAFRGLKGLKVATK